VALDVVDESPLRAARPDQLAVIVVRQPAAQCFFIPAVAAVASRGHCCDKCLKRSTLSRAIA
jgi:hypothetical protein